MQVESCAPREPLNPRLENPSRRPLLALAFSTSLAATLRKNYRCRDRTGKDIVTPSLPSFLKWAPDDPAAQLRSAPSRRLVCSFLSASSSIVISKSNIEPAFQLHCRASICRLPGIPGHPVVNICMFASTESTPKTFEGIDDEDEPMPDAEQEGVEPKLETEEDAEKDDESAAEDEAPEDEESAKSPTPPPEPVIRRRRLGRPPKNRPPDWDTLPIEPPNPDATPRRRGRGGWRGRGGRKGQHFQPTQQSIDKDGTVLDIVNDEVDLPEDPEGEKKVDKLGNLQDGREYRCRTFTVAGRGDRLYMLSTEPARCVGFRDSYLFFTKHKKLYKIIVNDDEKRDMIERDIIPHSYKGRSIGIVTARSVFREFGALIIVGGRRIIDDYEVAKAREEGVVEGELADPSDIYDPDKPYNKNQYVAWHGASAVYHSGGPSVPQQNVKVDTKKRRVAVNDVNWQLEHAREAS